MSHNLISHNLTEPITQFHLFQLSSHTVMWGNNALRGRRSTSVHMDLLLAQHVVLLELLLRGRCTTLTLRGLPACAWSPLVLGCFCVAGAAFGAHGHTFAKQVWHFVHMDVLVWQVQYFDSLGVTGASLVAAGPRLLILRGRRTFALHGYTFAWQAQHFVHMDVLWTYFCVAGAAL